MTGWRNSGNLGRSPITSPSQLPSPRLLQLKTKSSRRTSGEYDGHGHGAAKRESEINQEKLLVVSGEVNDLRGTISELSDPAKTPGGQVTPKDMTTTLSALTKAGSLCFQLVHI